MMMAVPGVLTACSSGSKAAVPTNAVGLSDTVANLIPSYIPFEGAKPTSPSVNGSAPSFAKVPETFVRSVQGVPGKGSEFTVMSPAWWATPPALDKNSYYQAVNKQLGATLKFQVADGNTYGDKIQTVLASPKDVADWVVIPSWNLPPRFDQAASGLFVDLSEYLAGDKVKKYPNLANIPSGAWKYSCFDGGLYGLPYPGSMVSDAIFYRSDIFEKAGIGAPTSAEEFRKVAKQLTDQRKNRYGTEDPWTIAKLMFALVPKWDQADGKLINRFETDAYREALAWAASVYKDGSVHPDVVAGNTQSKPRFESGQTAMMSDGVGAWHESLARVLPSNPDFGMLPMGSFAPGGGDPTLWRAVPASIFSFIKKTDDKAKIEEMLAIANFAAAPYGTAENLLINSGVEGKHFKRGENNVPEPTKLGAKEITSTYSFLVSPPVVNNLVQYPGLVEARAAWETSQAPFVKEDIFFGMQIQEPNKYASLGTPFDDLEKDIVRGRKTLKDLDAELATWKKNGGDALREYYAGFLA